MKRFAWLLFLLAGCSPGAQFPLSPPGDTYETVAPDDPIGIAAARDWVDNVPELSVSFIQNVSGRCDHCIYYVAATQKACESACFNQHINLGCTYKLPFLLDTSSMMVAQDVDDERKAWAWRHEYGHALGLLHTGPGTVMNGNYATASHVVTPADVAQYRAMRGRCATCSH